MNKDKIYGCGTESTKAMGTLLSRVFFIFSQAMIEGTEQI